MLNQKENQEVPQPAKKMCSLPCCSKLTCKIVCFVIWGLVLLAGAVFAGIQIGKRQIIPPQIPIDNGPVLIEVSPAPEAPTDWKTYKNEKYGFEFRYPVLWNLKADDFGKILAIRSDNDILEISVDVLPFGLDNFEKYKKYIEQKKELAAGDILYSTSGFADFEPEEVNKKESDSEGRRSVEYEFNFNKPRKLAYNGLYWSYISYGNRLVTISFKYGNSNDREIYNQILSTFKFLDQTSTDGTKDWKTYKNEKYGFEIKYPSIWYIEEQTLGNFGEFFYVNLNPEKLYPREGTESPIPAIEVMVRNGKEKDIKKIVKSNFVNDIPNESRASLNGIIGWKFEVIPTDGYSQDQKVVEVYFPKRDYLFILRNNKTDSLGYFNQILSTFKFLD